ncbi:conserved hypothetical protein [Nostocoides japonicum T1-X7]|uniref:DUF3052 domain-containing protein n=1 Tax=Nostocoides japonicum T1-X7 TaxID=1194083 RepID=A0A077LXJ7_9MICO|nr:DUF3052 domain-containing protein [Tetrasphaera japonica]CCH78416.1 conserved hypothetical protein [Tetrasphaera japonica T1-X7]
MVTAADHTPDPEATVLMARLGFASGQVVQEFGYDSDVDDDLRFAIEDHIGAELEDEDYTGVADAVLFWWRDEDGDLADAVVDALASLEEGGFVVLLTPKSDRAGRVDPALIDESASTAGLHTSGSVNACPGWTATRLVAPRSVRR